MNAALLSDVCHLSTRLQSAAMIHAASVRALMPGDSTDHIEREAVALLQMTHALAFKVGQLQASIASEVRWPKLDDYVTIPSPSREIPGLHALGPFVESEGGHLD